MDAKIIIATENPVLVISQAAGTSYGKDNYSKKRVETCINNGHLSVLEHVSATWRISDVSRSCTHQMVRHRLASYTEKSLRYTKIEEGTDWYVTPPSFNDYESDHCEKYDKVMDEYLINYYNAINAGIKPEDARFLLPLATKTEITVTMNLREFLFFYETRSANDAQWEIQAVAEEMFDVLREHHDDWRWLLTTYFEAKELQKRDSVLKFADNPALAFASQ